ncbi:serine hydrolase domain-containing protein [Aquipuribacter hungaricus]|uniref:Serine hydrolase domain-containing protein n=1 Tax=Aquipuribacter hungaricus TaxID=545624 RepID=A0ABV7WBJ5_9MICO
MSTLPTSTPSAEGVDAAGLLALVDDLEGAAGVEPHSLMVLRHGRVVAAGWWAPYTADRVHHLYSLSKTFTATAAGLAVGEGLLDLDEPVVGCFPELDAEVTDPRTRSMLVRHLASMSTGHTTDMWEPVVRTGASDPVRAFLRIPPPREPGSVFAYNQPATYTLAAIVQRRTGQTLLDYLRPRVLDPVGIGEAVWQEYPPGQQLGFSGLHATTDAVARLGQLYLQDGVWDGERLLPEGWVGQVSTAHVPTPHEGDAHALDWRQGYGLQAWVGQHGFRGDGAYGQFCLVLPEHDAVVAITGQSTDMQRVLDGVWAHLLPALQGAGRTADDEALAGRLAGLALPRSPGEPSPPAPPERQDRWDGAVFDPDASSRRVQPTTNEVRVRRVGDSDGWEVVLLDAGREVRARVGGEPWTVTDPGGREVPVAVSGGWLDEGTLDVGVAFLESPHRLQVTCRVPVGPGPGTVSLRWVTQPLGSGRLASLRAPGLSGRGPQADG